jgi:hypothetical protein
MTDLLQKGARVRVANPSSPFYNEKGVVTKVRSSSIAIRLDNPWKSIFDLWFKPEELQLFE